MINIVIMELADRHAMHCCTEGYTVHTKAREALAAEVERLHEMARVQLPGILERDGFRSRITELEAENAQLRDQLAQYKTVLAGVKQDENLLREQNTALDAKCAELEMRVAQQAMKIATLEYQLSDAKGLLEAQDIKEHKVRRVMARLADLLDEDQFAEIEGIVTAAGINPTPHFDNTETLRQYGEGEEP